MLDQYWIQFQDCISAESYIRDVLTVRLLAYKAFCQRVLQALFSETVCARLGDGG
jgi:hypothetical protein